MAENNSSAKKTAEWNESFFDDSQTVQSKNISEAQNKSSVKSSVEGTAAKSSAEKTSGVSSSSESAGSGNADVSEETKKVLWLILKKYFFFICFWKYKKSKTSVASQKFRRKTFYKKMSDGKSRELFVSKKSCYIYFRRKTQNLLMKQKK
ncbi:MAG: hypothetical protein L6V90_11465 [Treponema succinifaciens]|nr:MAG: hypothetical protein L6V90_11465 [Treponema succinifaciens]